MRWDPEGRRGRREAQRAGLPPDQSWRGESCCARQPHRRNHQRDQPDQRDPALAVSQRPSWLAVGKDLELVPALWRRVAWGGRCAKLEGRWAKLLEIFDGRWCEGCGLLVRLRGTALSICILPASARHLVAERQCRRANCPGVHNSHCSACPGLCLRCEQHGSSTRASFPLPLGEPPLLAPNRS